MYKRYAEEVRAVRSRATTPVNQVSSGVTSSSTSKKVSKPDSKTTTTAASKRPPDWKPLERHKSTWDKDVMISYSHQNRPFMRKLKGSNLNQVAQNLF